MPTKAEIARQNGKKGGRPRKDGTAARPRLRAKTDPLETQAPEKPSAPLENPFNLSPKELLFVEAYCGAANFNFSKAYTLAGYKPSRGHASQLGSKGIIQQAIAAKLAVRVQKLRIMGGDEALEGITTHARADIRKLFDEHGRLLPVRQWPDDVADSVKTITPTKEGVKLELYDKLRARELMAKAAGRLSEQAWKASITTANAEKVVFEVVPM